MARGEVHLRTDHRSAQGGRVGMKVSALDREWKAVQCGVIVGRIGQNIVMQTDGAKVPTCQGGGIGGDRDLYELRTPHRNCQIQKGLSFVN